MIVSHKLVSINGYTYVPIFDSMIIKEERTMKETIYDVTVIGSGVGGLSAAAKTSLEGAKTLLLEAMPEFGGYINPFKRGKYRFDTGLHYLGDLGENGNFTKTLKAMGVWNKLEFVELNPNGFCEYHFGGRVFKLPRGINKFKDRLISDFPKEEKTIEKLINLLLKIEKAVKTSSNPKSIKTAIKAPTKAPFMLKLLKKTYGSLIDEITNNKDLKFIFSSMSGETGLSPDEASPFMALVLMHYLKGAYYPREGSASFKEAFLKTISENNGTMLKKTEALRITMKNRLFVIHTTRGTFKTRSVISNVNPSMLFTRIMSPDITPPNLYRKAKYSTQSKGSFYAFIGTTMDITKYGISDANLIHSDTNEFNYKDWEEFPYFFLTSPTLKDPKGNHAPPGSHTLEIISYAPFEAFARWKHTPSMKRGKEYEEFKHSLGMRLIGKVEKYIPGLSKHIETLEFATPLTNEYWVKAPLGGCYGLAQTPEQMGPGRFSISTEIPRFYLCGASTIAGGISPSATSGLIAAKLALKNL